MMNQMRRMVATINENILRGHSLRPAYRETEPSQRPTKCAPEAVAKIRRDGRVLLAHQFNHDQIEEVDNEEHDVHNHSDEVQTGGEADASVAKA